MKKSVTKKHLSILLLFALLLSLAAPAANVNAGGPSEVSELSQVTEKEKMTFLVSSFPYTEYIADTADVKSVTSSVTSVLEVKKSEMAGDSYYEGVVKKTGKVTITIKKKNGKTKKCKLTVIKARNPFKKIKIGKSKAVFNSKLESGYACSFIKKFKKKFSQNMSGKFKLSIKMKKGYKLKKIQYGVWNARKSKMVYKRVKNNSKIKIPKMTDSTDWRIIITYKDKKSGATVDYQIVGVYYYNWN